LVELSNPDLTRCLARASVRLQGDELKLLIDWCMSELRLMYLVYSFITKKCKNAAVALHLFITFQAPHIIIIIIIIIIFNIRQSFALLLQAAQQIFPPQTAYIFRVTAALENDGVEQEQRYILHTII